MARIIFLWSYYSGILIWYGRTKEDRTTLLMLVWLFLLLAAGRWSGVELINYFAQGWAIGVALEFFRSWRAK